MPSILLALLTLLLGCSKTPDNSIEITTETQFREFAQQVNSGNDFNNETIILKNDIALTEDWIPIGDSANRFKGTFNGNGKTISGLSVNDAYHAGLFGYIGENGQVKNINIIVTKIKGQIAGGLAGVYGSSKPIENISVKADSIVPINVKSYEFYLGGLVGYLYPNDKDTITISNSYASVNLSGDQESGGLVGYSRARAFIISNSCASVNIFSKGPVGGLVGRDVSDALIISNSCAIGNVYILISNSGFSGGLVGAAKTFVISNSFYIGNVFTISNYDSGSGGLVGYGGGSISNSYALGNVFTWDIDDSSGGGKSGGLVGYIKGDAAIENSYARGNVSTFKSSYSYYSKYAYGLLIDFYSLSTFSYTFDVDSSESIIDSTIKTSKHQIDLDIRDIIDMKVDSSSDKKQFYVIWKPRYKLESIRGSDFPTKILVRSREDLKRRKNFNGWNFKKIWKIDSKINDGYPYLRSSENFIKELKKEHSELGGIHGTDSSDSRSKEEIMHFINLYMPILNDIYSIYLELKPGFSGKVVLKFTIDSYGVIRDFKDISILSSTTGFPEFDETIKNMVYSWRWQKIDGGSYTITVPFEFGE